MSKNGARFNYWHRGSNLDQENNGRRHGGRRHGMHDDAQRAMVGVADLGVGVRHLDDGHQGQQQDAHHRGNREASRCITAGSSLFRPWSSQHHFKDVSKGYTGFDASRLKPVTLRTYEPVLRKRRTLPRAAPSKLEGDLNEGLSQGNSVT